MTDERYWALERSNYLPLTQEEIQEGYHFCVDWDGMLIGPDMDTWEGCGCGVSITIKEEGG